MNPRSARLPQVLLVGCFPSASSLTTTTPSKLLSLSSIPSHSHSMIKCQTKLSRLMFHTPFWRWNCLHLDKKPKINFTKISLITHHCSSLPQSKGIPPPSRGASSKPMLADSINLPRHTRLRGSQHQSLLKIDPGMGSYNIDMHRRWFNHEATKDHVCPSLLSGIDHMRDPRLNKGLAFTLEERQALGIHGLMPPKFRTQEEQVKLCKSNVDRIKEDLDKYIFLNDLMDRNEHLFYRLLAENIVQMMPLVYTPTVGLACRKLGAIYRRARGLFISIHDKGHVFSVLKNWPETDVRAVVVTDGERILGLGDLGAQGMGIPVGKLSLYTALAGVKPHQCLPVMIDVGTNTKALRDDPNYIGLRQKRVVGQEYDDLLDEFMEAVVKRYGQNTLIQFEDFAIHNAYKLLTKYQDKYCTFNDDIQGTAAVAVAGLSASLRITNTKMNENTYLFLGAGGAATGISTLLVRAMVRLGIDEKDAASRIWMVDADGLLCKSRTDIPEHKQIFVKDAPHTNNFHDVVKMVKPTTIIGASAQGGAFTKEILTTMGKLNERPVIFALSNPTDKAECTAADAYTHTEGRAIFASGSPFPPFDYKGKILHPGQGNNSYIFPGVALGIIAAGVHHISDDVFLLAANTLAETVKDEDLAQGLLYPPLGTINKVSAIIAKAIVEEAYASGGATAYPEPENKKAYVKSFLYNYNYNESLPTTYPWPSIKK